MVVGVSRGVEDLEFVLLPLEGLALGQGAFDLHGLGVGAPEFVTVRVSEDVGHVLVAPDARGVVFLQVGQAVDVVVVVVAGQGQVYFFDAELVAQ